MAGIAKSRIANQPRGSSKKGSLRKQPRDKGETNSFLQKNL
jgi:hypothetical protein